MQGNKLVDMSIDGSHSSLKLSTFALSAYLPLWNTATLSSSKCARGGPKEYCLPLINCYAFAHIS